MYLPIHCHSFYSTLDAASSPEDYMARCKEIGVPAMALTDHGTSSGHRHFQRAAKEAGIKPLLGAEIYHTDDMYDRRSKAKRQDGTQAYNHLTVIATGDVGLRNLNIINKAAWHEGFYSKPRVGKDLLFDNSEGLIASSGCMSGMVAKAILNDDFDRAYKIAQEHKDNLGDNYYIEVMATNEAPLNKALLDLADKLKIKPVMTSDCHYASKEDIDVTEAMLILATNPKHDFKADLDKAKKMDFLDRLNYLYPDRRMTFQEIEIYLRSYEEERALFLKQGIDRTDIYANTLEIGDKVGTYSYHEGLDLLPRPKGDAQARLRQLCEDGLKYRKCDTIEYRERMEHELMVIFEKNFETYFLIVRNMINNARAKDIPVGPGRGSSAGSLVNYLLGITEVDPIKYNLLFWRFLDAGDATYEPKFEVVNG